MHVQVYDVPNDRGKDIVAHISDQDLQGASNYAVVESVLNKLADAVVDVLLKEKLQDIIAKVDMNAVANLVAARAAEKIAETVAQAPTKPLGFNHYLTGY